MVEPRSTFTFTRGLSYITCILFTRVEFTRANEIEIMYERSKKLKKLNLPQLSTFTRDTSYSLYFICIDNSMICSDIWHKYHT